MIAETTARGTASAPANCTDANAATGYTYFTTKYAYNPAGDRDDRLLGIVAVTADLRGFCGTTGDG